MYRPTLATAALVASMGCVSAAVAGPTTWEPPQILESDVAVIAPALASTGTDVTVAAWRDHADDRVMAAIRSPGQSWAAPTAIGAGPTGEVRIASLRQGAMATWCTDTRVMTRRLRTDGTWAAARAIATQVARPSCFEPFHIDAGGTGAMAVTWEREAAIPSHLRLAYRKAGGRWQRAERIPVGRDVHRAEVVDVAVDSKGVTQVVVAEERDNASVARLTYLRRSPGGVWSSATVIARPARGSLITLDHSVASDERGRLAVVWQRPSGDFGPQTVRARYRPAGAGTRFGPTRVLAEVPYPSWPWYADFAVDMSAAGRASAVWLTESNGESIVESARSKRHSAAWGPVRRLYRPGDTQDLVDVSVNARGQTLVTILNEHAQPSELRTVVCGRGGLCGSADLVPGAHPYGAMFEIDLGPTGVRKLLWTDPCDDGCGPRNVWSLFGEPANPTD